MKNTTFVLSAVVVSFFLFGVLAPRMGEARSSHELINAMCSKTVTCTQANPQFRSKVGTKPLATCVNRLSGTTGNQMWSQFGLAGYNRQLTAADVEGLIASEEVLVTKKNLAQCIEEMNALDCGVVENHVKKDFENVEFIVSDKGACPKVYTDVVPKTTTTGQLIESICSTYANCQKGALSPEVTKEVCTAELNGPAGKKLWDNFGLKKKRFKNQYTAQEIEDRIEADAVEVNVKALNRCQQEMLPTIACRDFEKYVAADNWESIDKAIGRDAPCKRALRAAK